MPNSKISALPSKAVPIGADITNILDSASANADKKITLSSLPISTTAQTALNLKLTKGTNTIFCIDNGDFATGQAAVDAATAGATIIFGVKTGGWGALVLPANKKLSLRGMQSERALYVRFDSITFSPTSGTQILENEIHFDSLYIQASSGVAFTFGGTVPARVRLNNCTIFISGTAKGFVFSNSNASSSAYVNLTTILSSSSATITQSSMAYVREYNSTIEGVSLGLQLDSGYFEQSMTNYSLNYIGEVINITAGNFVAGYSLFANTGANSSGVAVATGAGFANAYNTFFIPVGTGYCFKGLGFHVHANNNYSNSAILAYNVKVQNTLTNVAYTTAFTLSP